MLVYATLLLLSGALSLLLTAGLTAWVLRRAARRARNTPRPVPVMVPADSDAGAVIPYASPEFRPPLLLRHPWLAALACGVVASVPFGFIAMLPGICIPEPAWLAAYIAVGGYALATLVVLCRGCVGWPCPAALQWSPTKLLLASVALLGITAGTVWILDLRVKEKIAEQDAIASQYSKRLQEAYPRSTPAAHTLYSEALRICDPEPPTGWKNATLWSSRSPLADLPLHGEAACTLLRQAAQCTPSAEASIGFRYAELARVYTLRAAIKARGGDWDGAMDSVRDLYHLARILGVTGSSAATWVRLAHIEAAQDLTQFLIAEAKTPEQLAAIPLPREQWYQELMERQAGALEAVLPATPPRFPVRSAWKRVAYHVICYGDELDTARSSVEYVKQFRQACASPDPLAVRIPRRPKPALLSEPMQEAAEFEELLVLRIRNSLLELGVTCRRFEMRYRRMPKSLQELVDARMLEQVPSDVWDGAPLRCRLQNGVLTLVAMKGAQLIDGEITVDVANHPDSLIPAPR